MLAIGTRAHAPCCASISPVAGFSTMNARATTCGGRVAAACAAVTKASAAKRAATQIRRITSGKASAPAGDAAESLGREHQAQRPHSAAARLVCLAKGEGGLWRRVIAGQKPTCTAGKGTVQPKPYTPEKR